MIMIDALRLIKHITIVITLFLYTSSHAMIVGASCIKRLASLNKNPNRLVLLYDKHSFHPDEPIEKGHMADMDTLIHTISKRQETVPFLVEISEELTKLDRINNRWIHLALWLLNLHLKIK